MSQFNDIFTGGLVSLFYHADTTNTALDHSGYEEIKECAGFPETGIERGTVEVKSFSSQYIGQATVNMWTAATDGWHSHERN